MADVVPVAIKGLTPGSVITGLGVWTLVAAIVTALVKVWPKLKQIQSESDSSLRGDLLKLLDEERSECRKLVADIKEEHRREIDDLKTQHRLEVGDLRQRVTSLERELLDTRMGNVRQDAQRAISEARVEPKPKDQP